MLKRLPGRLHTPFATMKNKILLNLVLFTAVPFLLIGIYAYLDTRDKVIEEHRTSLRESTNKCALLIDGELLLYLEKSNFIAKSQYLVENILRDYDDSLVEMMEFYYDLDLYFSAMEDAENFGIFTIYVRNESLYPGKYIERMENIGDRKLVDRILKAPSTEVMWMETVDTETSRVSLNGVAHKKCITLYRNISFLGKSAGILKVYIPFERIKPYMEGFGLPKNGLIEYRDGKGETVLLSNTSGVLLRPGEPIREEEFMVIRQKLKNGHEIAAAVPWSEISRKYRPELVKIILVFFLLVLATLFVSNFTSQRITNRLNSFINKLRKNDDLLLNEDLIQVRGDDEIALVKHKFKEIIGRMNEIHKEAAEARMQSATLELELLQSKINPHLLYNSLSVVKWLAVKNDDHRSVELIETLTRYYRAALNKGNNILKVSEEIAMVHEFVKICELAQGRSFRMDIDIEEAILGCHTLKHLLQPVIENAILHGFSKRIEEARIGVSGRFEGDDILFVVEDNGHGMDGETLRNILNLNYKPRHGSGYGIKNLIRRIKKYYGEAYGVWMESDPGKGTRVFIRIQALAGQELALRAEQN